MKKLTSLKNNTITWIKNNKKEAIFIGLIILVGSVMRLYRIDEYMTFLGDEGRDAIVVRKLLVYADPILIGPGTSIGNMYLGPLYYYLIAPSLLLANFSPVGPSIFVALLGVVTIGFVYHVARKWFGKTAAFAASILYAISPTVFIYSRSSWNPNVMPFFALLCIYSIWKVWQEKKYNWLLVLGISFAFVLNSHYLGLVLVPILGVFWLLAFIKDTKNKKNIIIKSLISLAIFLFLMSPLVIFDLRHGGNNFRAVKTFFTQRETTLSVKPWNSAKNILPVTQEFLTRLPGSRNEIAGTTVLVVSGLFVVWLVSKKKTTPAHLLLYVWLIFASLGLAAYKQHIYDHYYGFFLAAPFLLTGAVIQKMTEAKNKYLKLLAGVFVLGLIVPSIINSPLKYPPNMQMKRAQVVSKKVIELANNEKFNFTLIAQSNYDTGYRYFLDLYKAKVTDIDPMDTKSTIQPYLFVVCEMPKEKCDPTHNPKAEVTSFGWSKIDGEWEEFGVTIFKLGHAR
ncbi:MAG: glycosyltransferase family 39 protein [Patescibacteria group bacterium]